MFCPKILTAYTSYKTLQLYSYGSSGILGIRGYGSKVRNDVSNFDARIELEFKMYEIYKVADLEKMRSLQR